MKYTLRILVPKDTKKDFCLHFINGQLTTHAKPQSIDTEETDDSLFLVYNYETNYKKYGKVLRFAELFNARMKHSSTAKLVKKLANRHKATIEDGDDRFFLRPANIDILEYPTSEEIQQANETWRTKIKKMAVRLQVKFAKGKVDQE